MTNFEVLIKIGNNVKEEFIRKLTEVVCAVIKRINYEQDAYLELSNFDIADIEDAIRRFLNRESKLSE